MYSLEKGESICQRKDLYVKVYSRFIHNIQKLKTTQMLIKWWMDKWIVIYPYNEMLFSNIKEQITESLDNMDEP